MQTFTLSDLTRKTADVQHAAAGKYAVREFLQVTDRTDIDVLELEGDDVAAAPQLFDRRKVVVGCDDLIVGNLPARRVLVRIERYDVVSHPLRIEREHPAELAAANHADRLN